VQHKKHPLPFHLIATTFIAHRKVPRTIHITCTQPLRVPREAGLDGGSDEAHTPGAMGRSHTSTTQSSDTLPRCSQDSTEEYFG
jgi:hypothetical protein